MSVDSKQQAAAGSGASRLMVWTLNGHGYSRAASGAGPYASNCLSSGAGCDWRNFARHVGLQQAYAADLLALQELWAPDRPSHRGCADVVADLNAHSGFTDWACYNGGVKGGAGFAWRTSRLTRNTSLTFNTYTWNTNTKSCTIDFSRMASAVGRFYDRLSGKYVNIVSAHLPLETEPCATQTSAQLRSQVSSWGGAAMQIIAGDFNMQSGDYNNTTWPWYKAMNDACYAEVISHFCGNNPGCSKNYITSPGNVKRIDFVFVNGNITNHFYLPHSGYTNYSGHAYSDHRAIGGLLYYP